MAIQLVSEAEALREENKKLRLAVEAVLAWLDQFGQHAPIAFGGEQELHDTLQNALVAEQSVERTAMTEYAIKSNCQCDYCKELRGEQ